MRYSSHVEKTKLGSETGKNLLRYFALASDDKGFCWRKLETIASDTEISERQIRRLLQIFRKIGLIQQVQRPDANRYTYNFFLTVSLIGTDLSKKFKRAFLEFHDGKRKPEKPTAGPKDHLASRSQGPASRSQGPPPKNPNKEELSLNSKTPLPPNPRSRGGNGGDPKSEADRFRPDYVKDALQYFAGRVGVTNPRVLRQLDAPLRWWMREKDTTAYDAAVEMVDRWFRYLNDPQRIGKNMPMLTFFTHGYWVNEESWVVLTANSSRSVH